MLISKISLQRESIKEEYVINMEVYEEGEL
jgi:hypothetical protein